MPNLYAGKGVWSAENPEGRERPKHFDLLSPDTIAAIEERNRQALEAAAIARSEVEATCIAADGELTKKRKQGGRS